jgi:predicted XRE-type DNA-binding protein
MTPAVQSALATAAALSFIMTSAGFVALVWRMSWAVRGFVEAERERAQTEQEIARMLAGFIQAQRETNDQVWTAIQVQASRVNGLVKREMTRD